MVKIGHDLALTQDMPLTFSNVAFGLSNVGEKETSAAHFSSTYLLKLWRIDCSSVLFAL
jgi:hypothetical protein